MWFFVLRYCNRLPFACRSLQPPFQYRSHLLLLSLSLPFPIPNPESPIPASSSELAAIPVLQLVEERSRAAGGDHRAARVLDLAAHQQQTHAAGVYRVVDHFAKAGHVLRDAHAHRHLQQTEERRVGKEGVRTCRTRGSPKP